MQRLSLLMQSQLSKSFLISSQWAAAERFYMPPDLQRLVMRALNEIRD